MSVEFDIEKRAELTKQIDQTVLSENAFCNIFHLNMYMAMKDTVEGLEQSPMDYYHINYKNLCEVNRKRKGGGFRAGRTSDGYQKADCTLPEYTEGGS